MAGIRITQRTLNSSVLGNLQGNLERMQKLQEQLSSGRQIRRPSDSPANTVSALRYRADIRRSEQLQRNASDGLGWLSTADTSLTQSLSIVNKARELALQGINASMSTTDRGAMAAEVDVLREHMLTLSNTTYLGRPVFGGAAAGSQAYDATATYVGDTTQVRRTLGDGVSVQVNIDGPAAFGPAGSDVFTVLADIANHLRTSPADLSADVTRIDAAFTRIQDALATVGARYHQVEGLRERLESSIIEQHNGLAEVESIDLPKTIVDLQLQEVAYKSALSAGARVLQPSLVDFLR
jgi:flagellar hook-associated protein 3 FlgL